MSQQESEAAKLAPCSPQWVHVHHLVSYCTRSIPGVVAQDAAGQDNDSSCGTACARQNCVFRMQRR